MKYLIICCCTAVMCAAGSASADVVLSYSADGLGLGTLANGTAINDLSSAGNNGSTTNGLNGSGTGEVSVVEDDPFGGAGRSFSFDGSSARIVTNAVDLLTDDLIAANGGYTMSLWVKTGPDSNGGIRSLLTFAGTDGLNIGFNGAQTDQLAVIHERGGTALTGPAIDDDLWHEVVFQVDTSGDLDGTAGSTSTVHNLNGVGSLFVDGALVGGSTFAVNIGDFGDELNRTISIGGHPQGFGTTEFTGLIYNPTVSLGVAAVPEPTGLAAFAVLGCAAFLRRRRK